MSFLLDAFLLLLLVVFALLTVSDKLLMLLLFILACKCFMSFITRNILPCRRRYETGMGT